ncbi:MAG: HisS family protein, partial [Nanoarchaeota archaeon]
MTTYEPDTVKGFPEFLPPQSQKYAAVQHAVEQQFKLHGFLPIKTPTVEFDELMRPDTQGPEDEAVSSRFKLQDRGGRNLGLRYEFTFQLARIFKQHPNIKLPFRRYQIGSVFRDEPTSSGRYREFVQCDADIIGDASLEADAECLALWSDIMKSLGIKAEIHVNHRKLANAILDSVQISQKAEVMHEIDKLDKLDEDTVKANLKKYADTNQVLTLFKLLEKDLAFFVSNMFDGADDIIKLRELGKKHGFTLVFDPLLVRGLSYYT